MKRRETTSAEATGILTLMLMVLTGCCYILKMHTQVALLFCTLLLAVYARIRGYTTAEIEKMAVRGINSVTIALLINLCIGMLISVWISAGTFAFLISILVKVVQPQFFLTESFLFCCAMSSLAGSCWVCAGTVGVILFSLGQSIGISPALLIGAILGGSRFGASISPISDTVNISVLLSRAENVCAHIRNMIHVLLPTAGACSLVYFCIDFLQTRANEYKSMVGISAVIGTEFNISLVSLLPAIVLVGMVLLKKSTLTCMLASIVTGIAVSAILQGRSLYAIADILYYGYGAYIQSSDSIINVIFARGGVTSVTEMIITLIIGMSLSGIANHLGLVKRIVNNATKHIKTSRGAIALSLLFSIAGYGATGDSQPSKVIVGDAFAEVYDRCGISRATLSCSLEMTSLGEILFPWTVGGAYYFSLFGVPINSCWYFNFFCFFFILFQIVLGGKRAEMCKLSNQISDHKTIDKL